MKKLIAVLSLGLLAGCGISPEEELRIAEPNRRSCTSIWQDANSAENLERTNARRILSGLPLITSYDIPQEIQNCMVRVANADGSVERARMVQWGPALAVLGAAGDGIADYNTQMYIRRNFR